MPRPAKVAASAEYLALAREAMIHGERNDCTVKAVAAATGLPYERCHDAMALHGRQAGKGCPFFVTTRALTTLGFKVREVPMREMLARYPAPHNNMAGLTTNQPDRFPAAWRDGKTYLMRTAGHILCIKNGVNCDWTRGTAKRAIALYEVTKI